MAELSSQHELRWATPQQDRSRRTLDRLCEAAETLLAGRPFEQIAVDEIAARAGCSVGGFYARLKDKDALFECLCARYAEELDTLLASVLDPARWEARSLAERVEAIVRLSVAGCRERHGLFRALAIRSRADDPSSPVIEHIRAVQPIARLSALLLERVDEMTHPEPELATRLGVLFLLTAIHEKILFPHTRHSRAVEIDDERLITELTRAFLSYVGAVR